MKNKREITPIGIEIKKALIDKGLTQVDLAKHLGISPKYINLIIFGERSGKKYIDEIKSFLEIESENIRQTA